MSKNLRFELRLEPEISETLDNLCRKYAEDKSQIIRKLILMAQENSLLEPNWRDLVIKDELDLYAKKETIRLKGEFMLHDLREGSKEKDRQLQTKLALLKEYMKTRTESEKRDIFDRNLRLGRSLNGEEVQALPSKLDNGYEVYINCKRVVVKELLKDGSPKLEYNQDRLVRCETGFHTKDSWCSSCEEITNCPIIREERLKI